METIDLSLLRQPPALSTELRIEILLLAPLSMTTSVAGSYYKSAFEPSKKMLCGLLENFLGWHFSAQDRKAIIDDMKKLRKKSKMPLTESVPGSTYRPLIWDYFEIVELKRPQFESYDDYWSRAFRRADDLKHASGTFQASHEVVAAKLSLPRDIEGKLDTDAYRKYFLENVGLWPMYYSTPTQREFIYAGAHEEQPLYAITLQIDPLLSDLLANALGEPCYLGTSEGWVDVKIVSV